MTAKYDSFPHKKECQEDDTHRIVLDDYGDEIHGIYKCRNCGEYGAVVYRLSHYEDI